MYLLTIIHVVFLNINYLINLLGTINPSIPLPLNNEIAFSINTSNVSTLPSAVLYFFKV